MDKRYTTCSFDVLIYKNSQLQNKAILFYEICIFDKNNCQQWMYIITKFAYGFLKTKKETVYLWCVCVCVCTCCSCLSG